MKNTSKEEKIRERILSDNYGKFDLVEEVLTKKEILNLKPRIVLKNITERLSLPEDKINRKTFWSWLRRYRASNKPINLFHGSIEPIKESAGNTVKEKADQEWIKNFKPSVPKVTEHTPVVIKVIRCENNSQKHNQTIKK
jgi:hypothetical protein